MMWLLISLLGCGTTKVPTKSDSWLESHLQKTQSIETQVAIIEEMSIRRSTLHMDELLTMTMSKEVTIRAASLEALVSYGPNLDDDRRDKQYIVSLNDSSRKIKEIAKRGILERLQSEVNTTFLVNALLQKGQEHQNWTLQIDIIQMLQWVSGEDIDSLFRDLSLSAANPQVRKMAVVGLGTRQMVDSRSILHQIQRSDLDEDVRKAAKDSLTTLGGKVNDIVAAVMPFTVQGDDPNNLSLGFQNYLSGVLSSSQVATIVERGQVNTVMQELIFQDQFINDNQAIQIGQSLRAEQVITGSIQFIDSHVTITVKRIDVASNEILSSAQVSGLILDFDALQRDVSAEFVERF